MTLVAQSFPGFTTTGHLRHTIPGPDTPCDPCPAYDTIGGGHLLPGSFIAFINWDDWDTLVSAFVFLVSHVVGFETGGVSIFWPKLSGGMKS